MSSPNPASNAVAVTTSDTVSFTAGECRALYVGVGGNISVFLRNGTSVTFVGVPVGSVLPVSVLRVNATNTTASSIVALY
jgi:hypothetical protein